MATGVREQMSIWFFCGVMLLAYGIIICSAGVWELSHPLAHPPVLSSIHAPIWWGAFLGITGLGYTIKFYPRKSS